MVVPLIAAKAGVLQQLLVSHLLRLVVLVEVAAAVVTALVAHLERTLPVFLPDALVGGIHSRGSRRHQG